MSLDLLISSLQRVNNFTGKGWLKMKKREKDEQEVAAEFPRHFDDCQDAKLTFSHTAGWFVLPPSSSGEFGHHIPGPFIF